METVFYHVTFKSRLDSILSEGIKGKDIKHVYSDFIRKHPDSVYAFLSLGDALKWWDYQEKSREYGFDEITSEGEQVIIRFTDNRILYDFDKHQEMRKDFPSAVYKIEGDIVKPEQIKQVMESDYIKDDLIGWGNADDPTVYDDDVFTDEPE